MTVPCRAITRAGALRLKRARFRRCRRASRVRLLCWVRTTAALQLLSPTTTVSLVAPATAESIADLPWVRRFSRSLQIASSSSVKRYKVPMTCALPRPGRRRRGSNIGSRQIVLASAERVSTRAGGAQQVSRRHPPAGVLRRQP